jgi:hypothetical protein
VAAYHYGPGQEKLELDTAHDLVQAAQACVTDEDYAAAIGLYDQALSALPKGHVAEGQRIRLERAKAQLQLGQLPAAYDELAILVPEMQEDKASNPKVLADAQSLEASTKYYLTWLMRLEGKSRPEWEPEIETARQLYRRLAEQAVESKDTAGAKHHEEDLEASIRLARMDLSELQALPLPCQCKGCCSGNCKGKGKGQCKGQGKSMKKPESDSFARGASSGPPPDGTGN